MSLGTESEPSPLWLPASHPLSTHNPPSAVSAPPPAPPPFPPHLFAVLPCSSPSPPCFDLTLHPAAPLLTTLPCSPPMEAAVSPLLAHVPLSSLTSPSPRSRPPLLAHVPLSSLTPPSPRSRPPLLAHVPLSSLTSPSPRSRPAHKIMSHPMLSLRDTAVAGMLPLFLTALTQLTSLDVSNTKLHGTIPATYGGLKLEFFQFSGVPVACPTEGSSCEINQNRSSTFCKLCSTFCSKCTPIN
ncbi:unnamed protein product, partial [Closterium sp. NIES-65]